MALLVGAGAGGGGLLGSRLPADPYQRLPYAAGAAAVALLAGSTCCVLLGVGAVAGMALAVVATVPLAAALRPA
jgi:hypothetical protein